MRIALIDSGIGLLSTAVQLRRARPDADLVLSMDPDHMPWGLRRPEDIVGRVLAGARAAMGEGRPDAIAVPCNTASVYGLEALRAEYEPATPVIGTVPPVKPAARPGTPIAVWATPATTRSRYQSDLIARFAGGVAVTPVACTGLAEAIEAARPDAVARAVRDAAEKTPAEVAGVVLGCTHYDLVSAEISAALGHRAALFTAAEAVAAQTLRRIGSSARPDAAPVGALEVLASGRPAGLPARALRYPAGSLLVEGSGARTPGS